MKASADKKIAREDNRPRESKALTPDDRIVAITSSTSFFLLSDGYAAEVNELSTLLLP